jgi:hypothetical protein
MVCRHCSVQHGTAPVLVELQPPPEGVWRARIEQRAAREGGGAAGHKPDWQRLQALMAECGVCYPWQQAPIISLEQIPCTCMGSPCVAMHMCFLQSLRSLQRPCRYSNCFLWPLTVAVEHHIVVDASDAHGEEASSHACDQARHVIRQLQRQGLMVRGDRARGSCQLCTAAASCGFVLAVKRIPAGSSGYCCCTSSWLDDQARWSLLHWRPIVWCNPLQERSHTSSHHQQHPPGADHRGA